MKAETIKNYFTKIWNNETKPSAPEGVCPNCWGRQEWESQFFELRKDPHLTAEGKRYQSFISKVVEEHVGALHKHGDKYVCVDCGKSSSLI